MMKFDTLSRIGLGLCIILSLIDFSGCNEGKSAKRSSEHLAETVTNRPNVLFIISDDLNAIVGNLRGFGQLHAKTPNIERLMKRGVNFTHAYSNDPLCAPSRPSLLSGLYPHTSGYFGGLGYAYRKNPVLKEAKTFVEHFRDHGYQVYGTGKIQHHGHPDTTIWVNKNGEYNYGVKPSFGPYPWDGKDSTANGHNVPHPQLPRELFINSKRGNYADVTATPLSNVPDYAPNPAKGIPGHQGWRLYKKPFHYKNEEDRDLMPDERSANYAIKVLQEKHDRPFFLGVGFERPHIPLIVPEKYFEMYPLDSIKLPPILSQDTADCAPELVHDYNLGDGSRDGIENYQATINAYYGKNVGLKRWIQAYLAAASFVDDQVGKILDALKNSSYADNTIIVFTSDHGFNLGEKDWLYKNVPWEESTHIPFIWAGPGIAKAATNDHPVSLIDIYPTLNDLCNLPVNPNKNTNQVKLDGYSLRPFLEESGTESWEGPDFALTYVASKTGSVPKVGMMGRARDQNRTIRTVRYRYILTANGQEELYDHTNDPYEWHNLADSAAYQGTKQALKQKMLDFIQER